MNLYKLFLTVCTSIFTCSVYAGNCTHYPIGLSKYENKKGIEITVSVAKTTVNNSIELAKNEARTKAISLLLSDPAYKSDTGKLTGVLDISTCIDGENVFAVVQISAESVKQANQVNKQMSESLKNFPTSMSSLENLSNQTEMKSEFDRLIKK